MATLNNPQLSAYASITKTPTDPEAVRLLELEHIIAEGEQKFIAVSHALVEIRDKRLYRKNYQNFEDYCQKRWFKGSNWANKMIRAAVVVEELPRKLGTVVPNEATARALSCIPEEVRPAVLEHIKESHKPVNSATVKEAAKVVEVEVEETKPPLDVSGCVIPQKILALRERREEVTQLAFYASKLGSLFEKLQSDSDPLFSHIKESGNVQTFMNSAKTIRYMLAECAPEVVCPQCEGAAGKCHYCAGNGWISEVRWNRDWVKSNDRLKQAEVQERSATLKKYA